MEGYLGESPIEFKKTKEEWALKFMHKYGQIDGAHHKQWVIDQVTRILLGTPVITVLASWSNGYKELRFWTGEPSQEYLDWVEKYKHDEVTGDEYDYDEGIAP